MKQSPLVLNIALAFAMVASTGAWPAGADDKAPMPQTKGMQGMDPAAHDRWATEGPQDPYQDCVPNPKAEAAQAKHPMPQTKGMQGMDPKAHTMDCPEPKIEKSDKAKHIHKPTPNS